MTGYFELFEEVLGDISSPYLGRLLMKPEGFTYSFHSPVVEATEVMSRSVRNDLLPWRESQLTAAEGSWTSALLWNFEGCNLPMALRIIDSILGTLREKDSYPCKLLLSSQLAWAERDITRETEKLLRLFSVAAKDDTAPLMEELFVSFWKVRKNEIHSCYRLYETSRLVANDFWLKNPSAVTLEAFLNTLRDVDPGPWAPEDTKLYEELRNRQGDLEVFQLWKSSTKETK